MNLRGDLEYEGVQSCSPLQKTAAARTSAHRIGRPVETGQASATKSNAPIGWAYVSTLSSRVGLTVSIEAESDDNDLTRAALITIGG